MAAGRLCWEHPTALIGSFCCRAKIAVLDEPTFALGISQIFTVLRYVSRAQLKGLGGPFTGHNAQHAHAVCNRFTVLSRSRLPAIHAKNQIAILDLQNPMAGGKGSQALSHGLGSSVYSTKRRRHRCDTLGF